MTQNTPLKIKSIAIIGGGSSGVTTLYDLTRALKDGTSLYGTHDVKDVESSGKTAFDEIVLFERNPAIGGIWSRATRGVNNKDPQLPDFNISENYEDPASIYVRAPISDKLEKQLESSSFDKPIEVVKAEKQPEDKYQWRSSAAYEHLFTNVPNKYMSFSYKDLGEKRLAELSKKYHHIPQFQSADDVGKYLDSVVEENDLKRYIRYNSNIERARKLESGKWEVTVRSSEEQKDGKVIDRWYKQKFDAVVIANGKNIPILPHFKNLESFAAKNKDKITLTHAKAIKDPSFLKKSKKILFVGSSVSSVDLAQYAFPRSIDDPTIFISRQTEYQLGRDWVELSTHSRGFVNKPEIAEFLPDSQGVRFKDGSEETGFDTIIFATGYHMHYPFLEDYHRDHPDLYKWYLYTFSLDDPTLALVGNTYAVFFFNRVESQGAALAGVWSGYKTLPSKEVQEEWYKNVFPLRLFAFYIRERFIDPLIGLALKNRPNPFDLANRREHVADIAEGQRTLEKLFNEVRVNEVDALHVA
ncbi:DEKNAAC104157 [Brettanomyces naardenensis]|uniref:DEKNAAC104157 n=1 Tax=Brettanomyces naardenensis TaxID=13370 RepID=A0A448YQ70_BRENA|nr:DEKNAAC104157 [Brettanomyces naardenensis]